MTAAHKRPRRTGTAREASAQPPLSISVQVRPLRLVEQVDLVGNTPLLYAVHGGSVELVRWLQRQGRSLKETNSKGHSAVIQASCGGHMELVAWLLKQGASLDEQDDLGAGGTEIDEGLTEEEEWFRLPEPSLVFNASQASTARVSAARVQEACCVFCT